MKKEIKVRMGKKRVRRRRKLVKLCSIGPPFLEERLELERQILSE